MNVLRCCRYNHHDWLHGSVVIVYIMLFTSVVKLRSNHTAIEPLIIADCDYSCYYCCW